MFCFISICSIYVNGSAKVVVVFLIIYCTLSCTHIQLFALVFVLDLGFIFALLYIYCKYFDHAHLVENEHI